MRSYLRAAMVAATAIFAATAAASAHQVTEGTIEIEHPHAAPTPAGAKTGAAYMEIVNNGTEPLVIKALSTPVAEKVEIHNVTMDGGIMRMRPMDLPITIAAGEMLNLIKDRHVMLIGLKQALVEEDMVGFKIEFENGKTMEFDLYVEQHHESHGGH